MQRESKLNKDINQSSRANSKVSKPDNAPKKRKKLQNAKSSDSFRLGSEFSLSDSDHLEPMIEIS